jgi:CRP-like cAMP-binding protein
MLDQIKKFDVFSNCNENLLKEVVKNLRIRDEKAGITILNQGDDTKSLYLILDGTLLVTQLAIDGKIVSLELSKKGQCFGEIAIIDGAPRSASVISLTDVKLGILSEKFVNETLMSDKVFLKSLLLRFAGIVRSANTQIFSLITANARKRLVLQLVRLSKMVQGNPHFRIVEKGLSHTAIGSFAGVSRETVTRLIGELKADNVISSNENSEIVLHVERVTDELSSIISNV